MSRAPLPASHFAMRVRLHLKPGQKGSKQLLAQYGDRLVCVRYRYDATRRKRFKTVELVVSEREWTPAASLPKDQIVPVRIAYGELEMRERAKRAGGRWNPDRKVWELQYGQAVTAGLADRILNEPASTPGCRDPSAAYLPVDARRLSIYRYRHALLDAGV